MTPAGRTLTGKNKTSRVKITCSSTLYKNIKLLIDESGEFTDISDFASSAIKHFMNIMYTDVIPEIADKCMSPDSTTTREITAKSIRFVSKYNDDKDGTTSFQVSLTEGIQQSFRDIEYCFFKKLKVPEMYRYALEYYFDMVSWRQQWGQIFLGEFIAHRPLNFKGEYSIMIQVEKVE